jgi:hypothetical protein
MSITISLCFLLPVLHASKKDTRSYETKVAIPVISQSGGRDQGWQRGIRYDSNRKPLFFATLNCLKSAFSR